MHSMVREMSEGRGEGWWAAANKRAAGGGSGIGGRSSRALLVSHAALSTAWPRPLLDREGGADRDTRLLAAGRLDALVRIKERAHDHRGHLQVAQARVLGLVARGERLERSAADAVAERAERLFRAVALLLPHGEERLDGVLHRLDLGALLVRKADVG